MNELLLKHFNSLYIGNRKSFIEQTEHGYYTHYFNLTDRTVLSHLEGKRTIGIKLGTQGFTKFCCFDVDSGGIELTKKLVSELQKHNLSPIVSISGLKGYHVELFFTKMVQYKKLIPFYKHILSQIGASTHEIEFRPSQQGLKLPLSYNRKSGKLCSYIDVNTGLELNPIILLEQVQKINPSKLTNFAIALQEEEAKVVEGLEFTGLTADEIEYKVAQIFKAKQLLKPHTRHWFTLHGSIWLYERGIELQDTQALIKEVLDNTKPSLIQANKAEQHREVDRLAQLVYEKDYRFSPNSQNIILYESELLNILNLKGPKLKQLYFSLLVYSKRYAKKDGTFYMAYSRMTKEGNTTNRGRLLKYLMELEKLNYIQIVSRGLREPHIPMYYQTNRYRVVDTIQEGSTIELVPTQKALLYNLLTKLVEQDLLKRKLSRREWQSLQLTNNI